MKNKKIQSFEQFNEKLNISDVSEKSKKMIVKNIISNEYGSILEIEVENGDKLIPDEDTGGEDASLTIDGIVLKNGDIISFEKEFDQDNEIWGLRDIIINNNIYNCRIESEGGNTSTFLKNIKN